MGASRIAGDGCLPPPTLRPLSQASTPFALLADATDLAS